MFRSPWEPPDKREVGRSNRPRPTALSEAPAADYADGGFAVFPNFSGWVSKWVSKVGRTPSNTLRSCHLVERNLRISAPPATNVGAVSQRHPHREGVFSPLQGQPDAWMGLKMKFGWNSSSRVRGQRDMEIVAVLARVDGVRCRESICVSVRPLR